MYTQRVYDTRNYLRYDFHTAKHLFIKEKNPFSNPINVTIPSINLFVTIKKLYELIALDLILEEFPPKSFTRPVKIPYFTLSGISKIYVSDFMTQDMNKLSKLVYVLHEIPDYSIRDMNKEYLYKIEYVQHRLKFMNTDSIEYRFEFWDKDYMKQKIEYYNRTEYLDDYFFNN